MGSVIRRSTVILFVMALMVAACGGASDETTTTTPSASTTTTSVAASTTTVTDESGVVSGLKGLRGAVVRITAEGGFVDPEEGQMSGGWSGSGFIIDPSGIVVTNNHVVTGAAFLQVHVEGEDGPRNAKILGVSECSDLAVIDIDGAGFPYLEWDEGDIETGTKVYAAGFPLGDPEYTLTEGIVSKEKADGETSWASVDFVIEHTAQILPGNSGGPLVTENGLVLGVNYSGINDLDIQKAISRDEVAKTLDSLIAGNDVNSIGVNGTAFVGESLSGTGRRLSNRVRPQPTSVSRAVTSSPRWRASTSPPTAPWPTTATSSAATTPKTCSPSGSSASTPRKCSKAR